MGEGTDKKKTKSGTKAEDTDEGRTSRSGGDMTSDHRAALKRVTLTPSTQEVLHFPHYSSFIFTWDHLEVIIFTVYSEEWEDSTAFVPNCILYVEGTFAFSSGSCIPTIKRKENITKQNK